MEVAKSVREITGQYIIDWCKEHNDVKWLKTASKNHHNFIALRTVFLERYDEFADLRPKSGKVPLWKIIEDL